MLLVDGNAAGFDSQVGQSVIGFFHLEFLSSRHVPPISIKRDVEPNPSCKYGCNSIKIFT